MSLPKWHRELDIFSKVKPLIMLEGNIFDSYQYPLDGSIEKGAILRLTEYLHYYFKDSGYQNIVFFDSIEGFYNNYEAGFTDSFKIISGGDFKASFRRCAPEMIRKAVSQSQTPTVIIMNFASRYIPTPNNITQEEVDSFTILLRAIMDAKDVRTEVGTLKNLLIMLVNKTNDIPAWFYLDNPNAKVITLPTPTAEERSMLVKGDNFSAFFASDIYRSEYPYYEQNPQELDKLQDKFVALTDGFSFTEINGLRRLCKNERFAIKDICDVIDLYKYGIRENPWKKLDMEQLRGGREFFNRRVKGQDSAVSKTLDIVKRAVTGMSGLQGSSHTRPKGVLFFAGPTGTGKTETAKTLAEMLFGDENSCIRFDMSEYGQSHSDQKLLGAPPGYVGYEAGGQLTNAVKNNPFSILLFDEIEKAHPSILDKFLQILEDGRMTDGQGNTVYFSECIIIFTINLGIYTRISDGTLCPNVTPDEDYSSVQLKVRKAIENYFKLDLGRPEILNRIGENIVVFDFIRPDVALQIINAQTERIISSLLIDKHIEITLSERAKDTLTQKSLDNLANGGRGIGNVVESLLINPLSRYLFDEGIFENAKVYIDEIATDVAPAYLKCTNGG